MALKEGFTLNFVNKYLFVFIALILSFYFYFLMVYAAADVYADQDDSQNNLVVHLLRFLLIGSFVFVLIVNKLSILKSKLVYIVLLWFVWMLFSNLVNIERYVINLTIVLLWPLCFLSFLQFSRTIKKKEIIITYFGLLFCFVSIMYFTIASVMNIGLAGKLASVNHIYYVILLTPWIFLIKKRLFINICLALILFLTLYSAKRGAILIVLAIVLIYLFYNYFRSPKGGISFKGVLVGGLLMTISIVVLLQFNESSEGYLLQRFESIEDDKGSGRLEIYAEVLENYSNSAIENKIFGHSHNSVKNSTSFRLSAHNDYIEIIYDYGIIGLFLFILLMKELFVRCRLLYKKKSEYFVLYLSVFIIFLFMTLISHIVLYPTYILFLVSCLGFIEPNIVKEIKK